MIKEDINNVYILYGLSKNINNYLHVIMKKGSMICIAGQYFYILFSETV